MVETRKITKPVCDDCGADGEDVRGCCAEHPGLDLCNRCYMKPTSSHCILPRTRKVLAQPGQGG